MFVMENFTFAEKYLASRHDIGRFLDHVERNNPNESSASNFGMSQI